MRKPALQDAREEWCILASPHFLHVLHNIMFPLSMCECTQIHCRPSPTDTVYFPYAPLYPHTVHSPMVH